MKTFIFAGNANIALGIADRRKIRRQDWKYVIGPDQLRGLSTGHVIVHPTVFRSFRWAQHAIELAELHGLTVERLPDDLK